MADPIEFDPVDTVAAGAVGIPGRRRFMIQATKNGAVLAVLLEKEQMALLAAEANEFLDKLGLPEMGLDPVNDALCGQVVDVEPLFRARVIGIGFDPTRELVLIELREVATDDEEPPDPSEAEGMIARLYATRPQVRALTRHGASSVEQGRPPCPLCQGPMDPEGHRCPRWN
jgi:uncharacterized repeat protein (TIGR03847 family)